MPVTAAVVVVNMHTVQPSPQGRQIVVLPVSAAVGVTRIPDRAEEWMTDKVQKLRHLPPCHEVAGGAHVGLAGILDQHLDPRLLHHGEELFVQALIVGKELLHPRGIGHRKVPLRMHHDLRDPQHPAGADGAGQLGVLGGRVAAHKEISRVGLHEGHTQTGGGLPRLVGDGLPVLAHVAVGEVQVNIAKGRLTAQFKSGGGGLGVGREIGGGGGELHTDSLLWM